MLASVTAIPGSLQSYFFDRLYGVSTRETVLTTDSVFAVDGDNNPYSGSQWLPVRRVLKALRPGPEDVLVDLGSGKGKVLLIAGRLPYNRVIGVEIDEDLSRCAQRNIQSAKARLRAAEVTSIAASVLDWPVPDAVSVVFMFNPFMGDTFRGAVQRILESYDRSPRNLRIIYGLPAEHDWLISTGRVVVENVAPANWPSRSGWWHRGDVLVTYRVVPSSPEGSSGPVSGSSSRLNRPLAHWSGPNGFRLYLVKSNENMYYAPVYQNRSD